MSLSDRDVPMAKAIFFIWEEKSSSMLALRGTGAGSAVCTAGGALRLHPAQCSSCPQVGFPGAQTRPQLPSGPLALQRSLCPGP